MEVHYLLQGIAKLLDGILEDFPPARCKRAVALVNQTEYSALVESGPS